MEGKRNTTIITPLTEEAHNIVFELIKNEKVEGHTFSLDSNKTTFKVCKGVNFTFSKEEVEEEILAITGIKATAFPMKINKEGTEIPLSMFKLKTDSPEDMRKITDLRYLLNQKVSFETPRKGDIIQCFNYQKFGHVSANCNWKHRCVKCHEQHARDECSRTKEDTASTAGNPATPPVIEDALRGRGGSWQCREREKQNKS